MISDEREQSPRTKSVRIDWPAIGILTDWSTTLFRLRQRHDDIDRGSYYNRVEYVAEDALPTQSPP